MKHLKNRGSRATIIVAAGFLGLAFTPAIAADLGGDCCADLEERVIELEQTTVRKGNRRVSLQISGHVARQFGWFEDEFGASEFHTGGFGSSGSRIQFKGSARLTPDWTAGYVIRLRISADRDGDVLTAAGRSAGPGNLPVVRDKDFVYLKHKRYGTFATGHLYTPTKSITRISLGGHGVLDPDSTKWNRSSLQGFELEQDGSHQAVSWVSPVFRGFTFGIAWADLDVASNEFGGNDSAVDLFDMALRYAQEFGPMRIAGGLGYSFVDNDEAGDGSNLMGSVSLLHTPSGVNVAMGAGTEIDGGLPLGASDGSPGGRDNTNAQFWHVEGGVVRNFFGPGKTSVFGEYGRYDYDTPAAGAGRHEFRGTTYEDATVDMWGLGVVQHFDSAKTELFLAYRNWQQTSAAAGHDGDVNQVRAGMRIKF